MKELSEIENPFDRSIRLKQALGVPDDIFARPAKLLNLQEAKPKNSGIH
jgi:hypothetical protein